MERYNARFDVRLVTFQHDGGWDWMFVHDGANQRNPGELYASEGDAMTAARVFALGQLQKDLMRDSAPFTGSDDTERRLVSEIASLGEDARNLKDRITDMEAMGFDVVAAKEGLMRIESRLRVLSRSLDPNFWNDSASRGQRLKHQRIGRERGRHSRPGTRPST